MNSKTIAATAMLTALSIGTNYAMLFIHNVKLMDLIVFVSGYCLGPFAGVLVGAMSWAVYGSLNPMGWSLPIWLSTMFSETIYGLAGAVLHSALRREGAANPKRWNRGIFVFVGLLGFFLTLIYDMITNIVFGYTSGWNILYALIVGFVPMGFIHVISNTLFFSLGSAPAINALLSVFGGEKRDLS